MVSLSGWGSSPRGRGKQSVRREGHRNRGLIPAWAGKTVCPSNRVGESGAHPRVGGENPQSFLAKIAVMGSSPRGRGKPAAIPARPVSRGLIPAWAGKTAPRALNRAGRRAHPRVGGENQIDSSAGNRLPGSSPRGRGKHLCADAVAWDQGLIPAWAGKTVREGFQAPHPARDLDAHRPSLPGSSPRGRGKRSSLRSTRTTKRLIPAWAGKTDTL